MYFQFVSAINGNVPRTKEKPNFWVENFRSDFVALLLLICVLAGSVKVWDPRQKDKPVANMAPAEGEEGRDCWCVAFGKTFLKPVNSYDLFL